MSGVTDAIATTSDTANAGRHFILGTAGHIDHGKTSLVRALTGTNTDRLPEERRRGMTIELGFAELMVDDVCFGVVDVPGHERFVRTMVSGATGIDVGLLVVAADDSVMPQTVEHVEILHLLGVRHGVIAITKTDVVDAEMVDLVSEDVRDLLSGTALQGAAVCPVSSVTGAGLAALRQALRAAADRVTPPPSTGPFRMTVDRVFTVPGRGAVVTGSSQRGQVTSGDTLHVWPADVSCRVRDLQAHGRSHTSLSRGQRCAINVSGVDRHLLERGAELTTPGYLEPSRMLDVKLECLPSYGKPLKSTSIVRLEIGTSEVPVRVVWLGRKALGAGESDYAQLRGGSGITSSYGQRFIVRDENATRTIGGGVVLRPVGRRRRRSPDEERALLNVLETGQPVDRLEQVLRAAGFHPPSDLQLCCRAGVEPDELPALLGALKASGRWGPVCGTEVCAVPGAVEDLTERLLRWLHRFHGKHPDGPGRLTDSVVGWLERLARREIAKPLVDDLVKSQRLKRLGRFVCLPSFAPQLSAADERILASIVERLRTAGLQPPSVEMLATESSTDRKRIERLGTLAVALGDLVRIDSTTYLHADAERRLRETVGRQIEASGGISVSEVREALGSTRKFVVPLLEYLDRVGYTRRVGDQRVLAETKASRAARR